MRRILKVVSTVLVLSMVIAGTLSAAAIIHGGATGGNGYPETVWSDMGKTGSVIGKVGQSFTGTACVPGAYVAIVNASNTGQEYAHTTSAADGSYSFAGVSATYSSLLHQGPDGKESSYMLGQCMYKILAKKGADGEPYYSASFGVDADGAYSTTTCVVLPVEDATATPAPAATGMVTATPQASLNVNSPTTTATPTSTLPVSTPGASATQAPSAPPALVTPEPTPDAGPIGTPASTPDDGGMPLIPALIALVIVTAVVVVAAIFFALRHR